MKRTHVLSVAVASVLLMAATWAPRVLIKVVDANGDAVPNAFVEVYDEAGVFLDSDYANPGGVARLDLDTQSASVLVMASSEDGSLVGEVSADFWKKGRATQVIRVMVEAQLAASTTPVYSVPDVELMLFAPNGVDGSFSLTIYNPDLYLQTGDFLRFASTGETVNPTDSGVFIFAQNWVLAYNSDESFWTFDGLEVVTAGGDVRYIVLAAY